MEPLLPRVLMEESRRQQQHYVRTAEVQRNLRETKVVALRVLDTLADRGLELEAQEAQAEEISESSGRVLAHVIEARELRTWWGWLKRCCCSPSPVMASTKKPEKRTFHFQKNDNDD